MNRPPVPVTEGPRSSTGLARALARPDRAVAVRPLDGPGDDHAVAGLFDETVLLGGGFDDLPAAFDAYRDLCIGWYLGPGRGDSALAVESTGRVVGYALVCTDESAANRWSRRATARTAVAVARAAALARLDPPARRFYRARLRDLGALARARSSPPASVHAHLNVAAGARQGSTTIALVDHIDTVCRTAGRDAWYGEMNERVGRRRGALRRLGFDVVGAAPNRTLSEALGEPVERLTIRRSVADGP